MSYLSIVCEGTDVFVSATYSQWAQRGYSTQRVQAQPVSHTHTHTHCHTSPESYISTLLARKSWQQSRSKILWCRI